MSGKQGNMDHARWTKKAACPPSQPSSSSGAVAAMRAAASAAQYAAEAAAEAAASSARAAYAAGAAAESAAAAVTAQAESAAAAVAAQEASVAANVTATHCIDYKLPKLKSLPGGVMAHDRVYALTAFREHTCTDRLRLLPGPCKRARVDTDPVAVDDDAADADEADALSAKPDAHPGGERATVATATASGCESTRVFATPCTPPTAHSARLRSYDSRMHCGWRKACTSLLHLYDHETITSNQSASTKAPRNRAIL